MNCSEKILHVTAIMLHQKYTVNAFCPLAPAKPNIKEFIEYSYSLLYYSV